LTAPLSVLAGAPRPVLGDAPVVLRAIVLLAPRRPPRSALM